MLIVCFGRFRCFVDAIKLGGGAGKGKQTTAALAPHYRKTILALPNLPSYLLSDDASANPKCVREHLRKVAPLLMHVACQAHRGANGLYHAMDNTSGRLSRPSLSHARDRVAKEAGTKNEKHSQLVGVAEDFNHQIRNDADRRAFLGCNCAPGLSDADWFFSLNMLEFIDPSSPKVMTATTDYCL